MALNLCTNATPASLVAVYVQMRENKTPQLAAAGLPVERTADALDRFCDGWAGTKKGRSWKPCPQNGLERFLCFSDGKVAGSVFVEPLPPAAGDGNAPASS